MYVPMPITDIALPLRHGILYKKLVASVTKMLNHYTLFKQGTQLLSAYVGAMIAKISIREFSRKNHTYHIFILISCNVCKLMSVPTCSCIQTNNMPYNRISIALAILLWCFCRHKYVFIQF